MILATILAMVITTVADAEQPPEIPRRVEELILPEGAITVPRSVGGLAVFDRETGTLMTWNKKGLLENECLVRHVSFDAGAVGRFAAGDDLVLFTMLTTGGPDSGGIQAFLVDPSECRIEASFSLPEPAMKVAAARDEWLVTTLPGSFEAADDRWPGCDVTTFGDKGAMIETVPPPRGLARRWSEEGVGRMGPCGLGKVFFAAGRTWFIPYDTYEFWSPRSGGRSEVHVSPPHCLTARSRRLGGEEALSEISARFEESDPELAETISASMATGRGRATVRVPAVSAAAAMKDSVVVAVNVTGEDGRSKCRLDMWDLSLEKPVWTHSLENRCDRSGFVAMGEGVIWIVGEGRRIRAVELPPLLQPLTTPCADTEEAIGPHADPDEEDGD